MLHKLKSLAIMLFLFLGIDHFLALECFHDVQNGGGKIESFVSFCGGLPAPECSDNPLGYKFSWSPRGALLNMLSGGKNYSFFGRLLNYYNSI